MSSGQDGAVEADDPPRGRSSWQAIPWTSPWLCWTCRALQEPPPHETCPALPEPPHEREGPPDRGVVDCRARFCTVRVTDEGAASKQVDVQMKLATLLLRASSTVEPHVTMMLQPLVEQFDGRFEGLDHRLKHLDSLSRKIKVLAAKAANEEDDPDRFIFDLHCASEGKAGTPIVVDALRYTVVFPTPRYTKAVEALRGVLTAEGLKVIDQKNFWIGDQTYRGINDNYFIEVSGLEPLQVIMFELQFHTAESLACKGPNHSLYEIYRTTIEDEERDKLMYQMLAAAADVPFPPNVEDLPDPVKLASRSYDPGKGRARRDPAQHFVRRPTQDQLN